MKARIIIDIDVADDLSHGTAMIASDLPTVPIACLVVGCEHLMTFAAMSSDRPFEEALQLLVDGAKSNHVRMLGGHQVQ